jgi:hypothetical protein
VDAECRTPAFVNADCKCSRVCRHEARHKELLRVNGVAVAGVSLGPSV